VDRRDEAFTNSVRDILLEKWDPVCIGSNPNLRDEYDSYLGPLVGILRDPSVTKPRVVEYLLSVEVREMGLPGNRDRLSVVAAALLELAGKSDIGPVKASSALGGRVPVPAIHTRSRLPVAILLAAGVMLLLATPFVLMDVVHVEHIRRVVKPGEVKTISILTASEVPDANTGGGYTYRVVFLSSPDAAAVLKEAEYRNSSARQKGEWYGYATMGDGSLESIAFSHDCGVFRFVDDAGAYQLRDEGARYMAEKLRGSD
jgi:hypothetical protein